MWNRKELKAKGKEAYRRNRLMCIIAAFLLVLSSNISNMGPSYNFNFKYPNSTHNKIEQYDTDDSGSSYDDLESILDTTASSTKDELEGLLDGDSEANDIIEDFNGDISSGEIPEIDPEELAVVFGLFGIIILIAIVIVTLLSVFLLNPLHVGVRKFFTENATDPKAGFNRDTLGIGFGENYGKIIGAMFTTKLFIALWTLLLIVPGIYMSYKWRMVPMLLGDDPKMTGKEARARSDEMMNGSKLEALILDLSFIGWKLLGFLTLGILNLIFTTPYQAATEAELYLTLDGRPTPPLAFNTVYAPAGENGPMQPPADPPIVPVASVTEPVSAEPTAMQEPAAPAPDSEVTFDVTKTGTGTGRL